MVRVIGEKVLCGVGYFLFECLPVFWKYWCRFWGQAMFFLLILFLILWWSGMFKTLLNSFFSTP